MDEPHEFCSFWLRRDQLARLFLEALPSSQLHPAVPSQSKPTNTDHLAAGHRKPVQLSYQTLDACLDQLLPISLQLIR